MRVCGDWLQSPKSRNRQQLSLQRPGAVKQKESFICLAQWRASRFALATGLLGLRGPLFVRPTANRGRKRLYGMVQSAEHSLRTIDNVSIMFFLVWVPRGRRERCAIFWSCFVKTRGAWRGWGGWGGERVTRACFLRCRPLVSFAHAESYPIPLSVLSLMAVKYGHTR